MIAFRINSYVSNSGLKMMFNGEERRFFVAVEGRPSGYLYPDGTIKPGCYVNANYNGWYKTEADAQAAIDTYNEKEKNMRTRCPLGQLKDLVENALVDLTDNDVMFTAYDVTLKLRSENPSIDIDHSTVRDFVSNAYYNGDLRKVYERELRDLPGQNVQAFVYAPTGSDFSQYGVAAPSPTVGVPANNKVVINATFAEVFTN
jgi:hypothetical protein